jgi:hypothetical protein
MSYASCSRCGGTKPADQFFPRPQRARGLSSWCRECHSAYAKQRRQERPPKPPPVINLITARCSHCGGTKPATVEYFAPRPAKLNGLTSWCRECQRTKERNRAGEQGRKRPSRAKPKPAHDPTVQCCTRCNTPYPATLEYFGPFPRKRNGLASWCRKCQREVAKTRQTQRRADPTERARLLAEKQRYNQSDRGHATKRAASVTYNHRRKSWKQSLPWQWTPADWERCKAAWGHRCAYCGASGELTQDHFIPYASPDCPGTVPSNMVPACLSCNCSKRDQSPFEWCHDPERISAILAYLRNL